MDRRRRKRMNRDPIKSFAEKKGAEAVSPGSEGLNGTLKNQKGRAGGLEYILNEAVAIHTWSRLKPTSHLQSNLKPSGISLL